MTRNNETIPREDTTMHCAGLAVSMAAMVAAAADESAAGRIPQLKFEKYTLANGLDVILHEDHSTPIVCVNIWYHVGSKNERRGRTGFAHLFEHMMFQGSQNHDNDYFAPLQEAGGQLNGSTNDDRTNYWEVVPSNYLELALWLESDRMGFLLPAMTQAKLDNQRDVVKNERRQSYENRPYGLADETIAAAMYPPDHPYSWSTIGSMADLSAASREDIADFFRRYYHTGNASLCIAGDFDPAHARQLVEKYFGSLPPGPKVDPPRPATPQLAAEKRMVMQDRVSLPRLYLNWHTVPGFAADDAELDLLASVLTTGKSSRLYHSLVHEKELAQDVSAFQSSGELAGTFRITATARPGRKLSDIEAAIGEELRRILAEPPSADELQRAVNRYEVSFVTALESVGGFRGRADRLNLYNVLAGDPAFITRDFERYLKIRPADLQRVAAKYLTDKRVVLEVVPGPTRSVSPDPIAEAEKFISGQKSAIKDQKSESAASSQVSSTAADTHARFDRSVMPQPAKPPGFRLPPIQRAKLANGLDVLVVEHRELPTVSMNLVLRGGVAENPADKLGLADLVAAVLDEGTEKRTATAIADELAAVGASLSVQAGWDTSQVRLFTLKRHLATSLDIFGDVLTRPTFPVEELDRQRSLMLSRLARLRDDPASVARLAVGAVLYGDGHPYGRPALGDETTLRAITRDDVVEFYRSRFGPTQATAIVVGDVSAREITELLNKTLADWKPVTTGPAALPQPVPPRPLEITLVDKPGAAQSVISVGQIGLSRQSPDYFPLVVMNTIFGGQFSSRLNMNLRENKGYTYGARASFDWRRQPGPYIATANVQTAVTAPALAEFLREFRDIAGGRPAEPKELEFAKAYITRSYPASFETPRDIAGRLEDLVEYGLADDYYNTVVPGIAAVQLADVDRVAKKYIDLEHLSVVVVGDRSQIESGLRALPDGKRLRLSQLDAAFRLKPLDGDK
jgi:zinc protease